VKQLELKAELLVRWATTRLSPRTGKKRAAVGKKTRAASLGEAHEKRGFSVGQLYRIVRTTIIGGAKSHEETKKRNTKGGGGGGLDGVFDVGKAVKDSCR